PARRRPLRPRDACPRRAPCCGRPGSASALEAGLDARDGFFGGGAVAEAGEPEIALAAPPEAGAGGADHVRLVQQLVEEAPRVEAGRRLHPDVRRVATAVDREPRRLQPLADQP